MARHRDIAASPVRTAAEVWGVIRELIAVTLDRSDEIDGDEVRRALDGAAPAGTALVAAGYDRSYADPSAGVHRVNEPARPSAPAPGCAAIELDATLRTVRMPAGVKFDGGGIGKGLAVDLIVEELLDAGATGACVNLGGDLRVGGLAPTAQGWILGVADPYDAELIIPVRVDDGAVVTSTRLLRRWDKCGRTFHHLIDPRTGLPSTSDVDAVTVVAGRAWWAHRRA